MFICVRNAECEKTLDIPFNKSNRKELREHLKSVVRSDPLLKYVLDIEAKIKALNKKIVSSTITNKCLFNVNKYVHFT